jgi:hypothetical protein
MKTFPIGRSAIMALAGTAIAALLLVFVAYSVRRPPAPPAAPKKLPPTIYCVFYDFTHASIVVGFDFAVTLENGAPPRFDQRGEAQRDGTRTTFDPDQRPNWTYFHDEDGKPVITSPDGATRIVLYGLKLDTPGELLVEAGLRSNDYRNLDGQCRQANFGSGQANAVGSPPGDATPK